MPSHKSEMSTYKEELCSRYWSFQKEKYSNVNEYFERPFAPDNRPPVFLKSKAHENLIYRPSASEKERQQLPQIFPQTSRHKWFGSMNSSQALAVSILGNLKIYNQLECLSNIKDESGMSVFGNAKLSSESFKMERKIDYLAEPRPTSLDGFFEGEYQISVECKFTEADFGNCSRPRLTHKDPNFEKEYCDGTLSRQKGRKSRCSLSEIGIKYWYYIPAIFSWNSDSDFSPCPIIDKYQIVRNILSACIRFDGQIAVGAGHSVIIYDARNPSFKQYGACSSAYDACIQALKNRNRSQVEKLSGLRSSMSAI